MPATGKQISVEAVDIGSVMGRATARAPAILVVPVGSRHTPVTPDPPARHPGPPILHGCLAHAAV